jgi:RNA ligase (TIGR02306 family)
MKSIFEWPDPKPVMCSVKKIDNIIDHPNADRLEIVKIHGWDVIVQKDVFKKDQLIIYFEIDSVLPEEIEKRIFGEDAKITLKKSRVRTIKIRKMYSQGLVVPIDLFSDKIDISKVKEDYDLTDVLNIKKYEEPIKQGNILHVEKKKKKYENPNFKKVRKPENIKHFYNQFIGKEVTITEKVHGSSFCAGYVKRPNKTIIDKIKIFIFGEYQFCYRSMNVQLQEIDNIWNTILKKFKLKKENGYYEKKINKNVYQEMVEKYDLKSILDNGYEITGEIYGDGIQKNYNYGCKQDERKLVCFGVRKDGVNISFTKAVEYVKNKNLEYVPVLYSGILTEDILKECTNGKSILCPKQKVREGCVLELVDQENEPIVILKSISEKYLMGDNTDFH